MDCERSEELLIDFMEDEIDASQGELVKEHLNACPYCSKKLEEYREIRKMFKGTLPQPSSQVLARLSKAGREVSKNRTPFWRRWFYSPILVPVLSSALALFLWISYGQKNINYSPGNEDIYSTEAVAKKSPIGQSPNLPEIKKKIELGNADSLSNKPFSPPVFEKSGRIKEESALSKSAPSRELTDEMAAKQPEGKLLEQNKAFDAKEKPLVGLKESPNQEFEERRKENEKQLLYSYRENDYQNQLDLALKQQKEGNCEASIKTNEELINASPPPPNSVKEKTYLSLAECYEQKRDWGNAILSYQNLKEVAPDQTAFVKDRIEEIRQKTPFLKQEK